MNKKLMSIGLASSLVLGGVACAAEKEVINEVNHDKVVISENEQEQASYINYRGEITDVTRESEVLTITVKGTDKSSTHETIKFNLGKEDLLLSDKTLEGVERASIEKGMMVEVLYSKDAPMTKSLPPMTNAKLVVVREAKEEALGVKLETFDKTLTSIDNYLKLTVTEDTIMVDKNNKKINIEDLYNKELLAFYGPVTTLSIPAQSKAVKIIALEEKKEIKSLGKIIYKGKEINLKNKMYKSGDTVMMPIREVGENFGYKVNWNHQAKQAELTKDSNFITASANEDMYSFAKMIVKLGKASETDKGTMFVPVSFVEKVMSLDVEVTSEGIMSVK